MKKMLFVAALAAVTVGLSGCNTQTAKADAPVKAETAVAAAAAPTGAGQAGYDAAVTAAKAEIKKAKSISGEWRDTGKLMKKADKAASKGDFDKAIKLAEKARMQAVIGQEQAASQVNVGNPGYLY